MNLTKLSTERHSTGDSERSSAGSSKRTHEEGPEEMLIVTLAASFRLAAAVHRGAPTNALLRRLRNRENLKWGLPLMLLGVLYLLIAAILTTAIDSGWPEWLYLPCVALIWTGLKFLAFGPVSVLLLAWARFKERARSQRLPQRADVVEDVPRRH